MSKYRRCDVFVPLHLKNRHRRSLRRYSIPRHQLLGWWLHSLKHLAQLHDASSSRNTTASALSGARKRLPFARYARNGASSGRAESYRIRWGGGEPAPDAKARPTSLHSHPFPLIPVLLFLAGITGPFMDMDADLT